MEERVGAHQHRPVDAAEAEPVVHDPRRVDEVAPDSGDVEAGLEGASQGHVVDDGLDEPRLEPVDRLARGQLAPVRLNVARWSNAVVEAITDDTVTIEVASASIAEERRGRAVGSYRRRAHRPEAVTGGVRGQGDDSERGVVVGGDEEVVVAAREPGSIDRRGPGWRELRRVGRHDDDTEPVGPEWDRRLGRGDRRDLPIGEAVAEAVRIVLLPRRRGE